MLRKAIVGATSGTLIEYYDYAIYAAVAPYIARAFFPATHSGVALLETFAVFAISFVARPLGAVVWGPVGDKIGRLRTLVVVVTLMGTSTVAIGLLPSYSSISVAAPLLLVVCRLLQGISAGGELAGASTYVAEFSADDRRALNTSWLQLATTVAFIPALAVVAVLDLFLSDAAMNDWGWRVPFLLAAPLTLFSLYMRTSLHETPKFLEMSARSEKVKTPLRAALKYPDAYRQIGVVICMGAHVYAGFYFVLTYLPALLTGKLNYPSYTTTGVIACFVVVSIVAIPCMGWLADKRGRRPVLMGSALGYIVLALPCMLLLQQRNVVLAFVAAGLLALPTSAAQAMELAGSLERFPTCIRYTGYAVGLGLVAAIFGGTTPFVSEYLIGITGSVLAPAGYLMALSVAALFTGLFMSETARLPLREE